MDLLGSIPSGLSRGSSLAVDYDPQHPSDVMLPSQVHGGTATIAFFVLFGLAVVLAGGRVLWLALYRPGQAAAMQQASRDWSTT